MQEDNVKVITVAELIEFLKLKPQNMGVAYQCFSEQCALELGSIATEELGPMRPDGWIENKRPDKPTTSWLVFPGN